MTCRVIAAALVLMTVFGARTAEASEDDGASDELALLATEAGVDPVALAAAVDTVGVPPRRYLEDEGLLQRPTPTPATTPTWPIRGDLGQRLWCIEGYESRHSGSAVNPTSGARRTGRTGGGRWRGRGDRGPSRDRRSRHGCRSPPGNRAERSAAPQRPTAGQTLDRSPPLAEDLASVEYAQAVSLRTDPHGEARLFRHEHSYAGGHNIDSRRVPDGVG